MEKSTIYGTITSAFYGSTKFSKDDMYRVSIKIDKANRDKLAEAEAIIPGMDGPTILEVAGNADFVAVHAVVDSDKVFHTINELKKIGARGILTTPIERLVN